MRERDDLDAFLTSLTEEERDDIDAAGSAIDLAILLYRARELRGLTQATAAARAGLAQQAVSRLEQPPANPRFDTLRRYLGALGYELEITLRDAASHQIALTFAAADHANGGAERTAASPETRELVSSGVDQR